jgi:hypothetical protein
MNVTPDEEHPQTNRNSAQRPRPYEQRQYNSNGGRGRYNKNFRPPTRNGPNGPRFSPVTNNSLHYQSPTPSNRSVHTFLETTPPSNSGSSVTIRPWSPVKGGILAWDDA